MVCKFLALFFSLLFFLTDSAFSYDIDNLSNEEGREILCSVLTNLKRTNGKGVWPKFDPLEAPLIVKFRDHIYGYGNQTYFSKWKREKSAKCTSYLAPNSFTPPKSALVPYFDFNGTQAFFFDVTIKPKLSSWLISTVIHERFHRFQFEHFSNLPSFSSSTYTAHLSLDRVVEALLENRRLVSYLKSRGEKEWIDFLSIALIRESRISQESKNWELGQQVIEGTADYVSLKALELVDKEFKLKFRQTWEQKTIASMADGEGVDGIIKWRHYAVGNMICNYLDLHSSTEDWKLALQVDSAGALFRKTLPFVNLEERSLQKRGQEIITSSEGDQVRALSSKFVSKYLSDIEKTKKQIERNRFQIKLRRPSKSCSGGGSSGKTYYLAEGGTLALDYSGYHECGSEYNETFTGIEVLQEDGGIASFGLDNIIVLIDSSELSIKNGTYSFRKITIRNAFFVLESSQLGIVTIDGSRISVTFDR